MYHTSPTKITEINKYGIAGDCLFFSDDIYQMSAAATFVYEADFSCVSASQLFDENIITDIANFFSVDLEVAEDLLDGSKSEWDYECDGESSWWLQGKRGQCAVKMGYDGCKDSDEQGRVYIVPMSGKVDKLKLIQS